MHSVNDNATRVTRRYESVEFRGSTIMRYTNTYYITFVTSGGVNSVGYSPQESRKVLTI